MRKLTGEKITAELRDFHVERGLIYDAIERRDVEYKSVDARLVALTVQVHQRQQRHIEHLALRIDDLCARGQEQAQRLADLESRMPGPVPRIGEDATTNWVSPATAARAVSG